VCGRTILDGEQVHSFVSADGRHAVCPLCEGRTAELGWLPADQEGAEETLRAETTREPGFLARLFARPERSERPATDEPVADLPPPDPGAIHELDTERYDVEAEWTAESADADAVTPPRGRSADLPAPGPSSAPPTPEPPAAPAPAPEPDPAASLAPLPDPAGRGMRPRRLQPDVSPTSRFERAIARFNAGDAGRTVAGLTRTLGAPSVSVGDLAGAADEVRVTVAWELTWYQWGVDLGDELRPVYELKKGFEVEEIDSAARQWNASAHEGRIVMVAPARREAANGRPVHR
jgi:hypothetical protein